MLRTRLVADSTGLTDHRFLRTVRLGWEDIAGFEVGRPGGTRGGFCVRALRPHAKPVDLVATRAYAMIPSGANYDELYRIMWTLEEALAARGR